MGIKLVVIFLCCLRLKNTNILILSWMTNFNLKISFHRTGRTFNRQLGALGGKRDILWQTHWGDSYHIISTVSKTSVTHPTTASKAFKQKATVDLWPNTILLVQVVYLTLKEGLANVLKSNQSPLKSNLSSQAPTVRSIKKGQYFGLTVRISSCKTLVNWLITQTGLYIKLRLEPC